MALTGLFLVLFLIVHLSGNLQLLRNDNGLKFNEYAHFMTTFWAVKLISYLLYTTIILHVVDGFYLTFKNKKARPVSYAVSAAGQSSPWYSRSMALLGSAILFFLVVHLWQFWYRMHWGTIGMDSNGYKDLYAVVREAFHNPVWMTFYVISMIPLAYHLLHGFQSGFQTLGWHHSVFTPIIKKIGVFISVVVPVGFALIPLIFFVFK